MGVMSIFDVNIYAFLLVLMVYVVLRRGIDTIRGQAFAWMLLTTMFALLVDYVSDRCAANIPIWLAETTMFLTFLMCTVMPWPTFLWVRSQLPLSKRSLSHWTYGILLLCGMDLLGLLASRFTHWYFYFDAAGYHRGDWFALHAAFPMLSMLLIEIMILRHRKDLRTQSLGALLFFQVPVLISLLLSVWSSSCSFVPAGVAFSVLTIFITVQSHTVGHDYRTGVYNRRRLELHLQQQIESLLPDMMFAVILVDLRNFPQLIIEQGTLAADQALCDMAAILQKSVRYRDFVARYSSHTFCIVLDDVQGPDDIVHVISRIQQELGTWRQAGGSAYDIEVHTGYDLYSADLGLDTAGFLQRIDQHFLQQKKRH